jgi:hypothetical protein
MGTLPQQQRTINYADRQLVRNVHQSIVSPANGTSSPGHQVTPVVIGSVLALSYDNAGDDLYVEFKIPRYYANGLTQLGSTVPAASFHIHWTKDADADESGNTVTWQIEYTVFPGNEGLISTVGGTETVVDTYEDASTDATRYAYRTTNIDASSAFVAGYYCGVRVSVAASTLVTSNPSLISCDLIMAVYANREP